MSKPRPASLVSGWRASVTLKIGEPGFIYFPQSGTQYNGMIFQWFGRNWFVPDQGE